MTEGRDYEFAPHLNREDCDEEEEYRLISEGEEEVPHPDNITTYPRPHIHLQQLR